MKDKLKAIIKKFQDKRIVVWGDLILDEYIYTSTSRISREAPVLITEFESNEFILGGAGNVVANIKALGAIPVPVGFIGKNADGEVVKSLLRSNGISTQYRVELDDYRTPKKSRILSGGDNTKKQQVLRIDSINRTEIKEEDYKKLEKIASEILEETNYVIFSDYIYKSVTPPVLNYISESYPSHTIIMDSRYHLPNFKHISIATPNEPEIKAIFPTKTFYNDSDFHQAGFELLEKLDAKGLILKRGHKGMVVFEKGKNPEKIDIHGSANIVDVTGAGDTVIAVLGLSLSVGADLISAAQMANIAAGFVVMKQGAYPIRREELENEIH